MYWLLFPFKFFGSIGIVSNITNKIKYAVYKPSLNILSQIYSFTPLGTESAQSASSLSLITAHEVGVLNVQRCNITGVLDEQLCNRCKSNSIYSDITNNSSDIDVDVENYFNGLSSAEHLEYMEDLYNYNLDNYNIISPNSDKYYCN